MMEVELLTKDGRYVTKVTTPAFKTMPDAIQWGSRFFIRNSEGKYLEGFVFFTVEEAP